jgi:hypothetical protein
VLVMNIGWNLSDLQSDSLSSPCRNSRPSKSLRVAFLQPIALFWQFQPLFSFGKN